MTSIEGHNKAVRRLRILALFSPGVSLIALAALCFAFRGDYSFLLPNRITVMTRNLYVGASFAPLLDVPTRNDLPERVAQIYEAILSSRFARRAEAIADEIALIRPDIVGVQEAPLLIVRRPDELVESNQPASATEVRIDYLHVLVEALRLRGASYAVATLVNNTDLTAPSRNGETIRFLDRDVLLVRSDLPPGEILVSNTQGKTFDTELKIEIAGEEVTLLRGWCSVDLKVRRKSVRIVNTHLEDEFFDIIQFCQAQELLDGPLRTHLPVIVLGDFNSREGATVYRYMLEAGVKDSWALAHPGDPGFTCCQDEDLLNSTSELKERIDLVFLRGDQIRVHEMKIVGAHASSRLPSGHWPSDHAGVVATFSIQ